MKNMVMYREGEHSWIAYIKARIKQNLNFMAIAEGPTGVGKTWAMLSVAYMIDPEFSIDQVAFSFRELMSILNSDLLKNKKFKVILFDEAQTDINNRTWQGLTNKLMLYLTSTFRHQNVILLFASPYSDFVDSATMKLIHCKFLMKGVNTKLKVSNCRPKLQQYNPKMKKFYEHSLMVSGVGGTMKITNWAIPKPPKHLIIPYEEKKTAFTSELNRDIERQLNEVDKKLKKSVTTEENVPEELSGLKPLTNRQKEVKKLYEEHKDQNKVAEILGLYQSNVSQHLMAIKKKGYKIENGKNH